MTRPAKIVDATALAALRARIRALELGQTGGPDSGPPGTDSTDAANDDQAEVDAASFGAAALDDALPWGGLPRGALHELEPATAADDIVMTGALSGFAAALAARLSHGRGPLLWCLRDCDLYAPGLPAFGLDPAQLIIARARSLQDTLWVLEEGLRSGVCGAVLGEIEKLDLTASRRLQLAARAGGTAGLLLYRGRRRRAGLTAAVTRWRIAPDASAGPVDFDELGRPRWQVELTRCRGGAGPRHWRVEWCHETNCFRVAAAMVDRDHDVDVGDRRDIDDLRRAV